RARDVGLAGAAVRAFGAHHRRAARAQAGDRARGRAARRAVRGQAPDHLITTADRDFRRPVAAGAARNGQNPGMVDLSTGRLQPLAVPDATILCLAGLGLREPPASVLARLVRETPWRREPITLWGKPYPRPRLTAWYGDPGSRYRY